MSMFRKVLMIIGLLLATNAAVLAQGTLKGTVTDKKTGEEMPLVNVLAKQNGQQVGAAQTGFDGVYTIKGLPVGKYDIEVSYVGYAKYIRTGVEVRASGLTVVDVPLEPSSTVLDVVEIVEDKVPVIEIGSPETGQTLSSDDIARMPGNSVESIVAAVGGVGYNDGGTGSARGEDNMVTMQGNVRKRTGVNVPKEAIAEIKVILGGTPASIGEAIGGTQVITLKPPSPQFKGLVKYETYLDYRLSNSLVVYLTGPVLKRKVNLEGGGVQESTLVGFRFTGQGSYAKDSYYRPKYSVNKTNSRYQIVKDEVVSAIEQNPIQYDPVQGTVNYAGEKLYSSDFTTIKQKPNMSSYSIALEGAFNIRFSDYATLEVTGEYDFSRSPNTDVAYFPLNMSRAGNGVNDVQNMVLTVDYTQRFPDAAPSAESTLPDSKSEAAISNVMFNITGMLNKYTVKSYNETFGGSLDDVFKYGYIGKFFTTKTPTYALQSNFDHNGITRAAYVQDNWLDNVDLSLFEPYAGNQILANYTLSLYNNEDLRDYLYNFDNIRSFYGLVNGDSPASIYGMFYNVGTQNTSYAMQTNVYRYLQAKASALIKGHDIEIGFQYDNYSASYYAIGASSLWTIMRQDANKHISQMDLTNPQYEWRGADLYVNYDRLLNPEQQTQFDSTFRSWLSDPTHPYGGMQDGVAVGDRTWIDIDRYTPEDYVAAGGLSMFSSDELFNNGNSIVSYYGYTHDGQKYNGRGWSFDDFFNTERTDHYGKRLLPAFSPTYIAGYIQDQFYFKDLIFNVGVRVDYFDGNQFVLKDPYLLYDSYTVSQLQASDTIPYSTGRADQAFASNAEGDWVVYVDDPSASNPTVVGYRSGSVWYDANGTEVSSPSAIAGKSGKPTPYRTRGEGGGQEAAANNTVYVSAFEDYKPQIVPMPRIAFAFPVSDKSQFKASYDIIARRPSSGWQADYLNYLFMSQISSISNPNLKPERITNYELGFQQALNESSAIGISAYYKETRDLIQLVQYAGADPNQNYYSYDNLDFKTIKGFTFSFDKRQTKNIRINANYTLQYAEGTGLSTSTMTELIKEGYTTLKMLNPISDDRRHEFKANVDFRYGSGSKYNGPTRNKVVVDENGEQRNKEVKILENFGVNFMAVAQSGRPYTRAFSNTQSTIVGSYRGARLPWCFYFNIVVDKTWPIKAGKRETYLNAAVTVNNLFDIRNVTGVFSVTGNPADNGYLTDPETQSVINAYLDPQSFRDIYAISMCNNYWNYSSPRTIRVTLSYNF